jgi:hypothetical protein
VVIIIRGYWRRVEVSAVVRAVDYVKKKGMGLPTGRRPTPFLLTKGEGPGQPEAYTQW